MLKPFAIVVGSEDVVFEVEGGELEVGGMVKEDGREEEDFDLPVTSPMSVQVFLGLVIALEKQVK